MRFNSQLDPSGVVETGRLPPLTGRIPSVRIWNAASVLVLALVAYYGLFRLPFLFPPRQRLMSASYAFGFNNSIAILAMAGLLGFVTLMHLLWRRHVMELPIAFPSVSEREKRYSLRRAFAVAAVGYALLTVAMYIYNVHAAPSLMWETRHLLYRTWLMDLYGLHAYTEVAAEYGPILTYAPSLMYWLLRPLGASHEQAYFACHLLLNLAGLWCIYYVLSRAVISSRARIIAFAILAVAGFAPWMGVNGVLVRYLFPFASLLLGHRVVGSMLLRKGYVARAGASFFLLLLLIANILLSPEIGVAFTVAWLGYAVLNARADLRILTASITALVGAVLFCWLTLPVAYYGTLLRFSEGANNLPLLPASHLLFYIATLFWIVPLLLASSVRRWWSSQESGAALCGAFGILCLAMSPGALGRCDPPHVLLYGMGASILLMIRLANISWRQFAVYTIGYACVSVLFLEAVNLVVFYGVSPKTLLSPHPIANLVERFRDASNATHPDVGMLSALDHYPRIGLPFASFGDPAVEKYVVTSGKLDPEYYVAIVGVYSSAAVERKLHDVGRTEYLLVPEFLRSDGTAANPCGGYLKSLRQWFFYPAKLPCRASPLDPLTIVKSFIADNYAPVEQIGSWWVLRRTNSSPKTRL